LFYQKRKGTGFRYTFFCTPSILCHLIISNLYSALLPPLFHNPPPIPNVRLPISNPRQYNDRVSIVPTFPPIYLGAQIFLFSIATAQLAEHQHHRQQEHPAFLVLKAKRLQQSICLYLSHSLIALQSFYRRM